MSAAEHQSRNTSSQPDKKSLNNPPQRPSLLQPPPRPATPAPKPSETKAEAHKPAQNLIQAPANNSQSVSSAQEVAADIPKSSFKNHPIAPPSEPMQYRAIGLVRGVYQPSEEQLNRGNIMTDDGAVIDSVLLGRVTSLIKKHIDLESSHLWVVYPRTRQVSEETEEEPPDGSNALHLQIVGVWEPETLGLPGENPQTRGEEEEADTDASLADQTTEATSEEAAATTVEEPADNYFSIRGEIINYDEEREYILVKIVQGAKRSGKPPKAFKLRVAGKISGKTVGYFWELDVKRQGEELTLTEGRSVGIVPPKKKKKGKFTKPRKGGRRPNSDMDYKSRPTRTKEKPRIRPSAPVKSNPL